MCTEPVYYEDSYLQELEAKVQSIDGRAVVLDRTICYPEGGGQPGDRGFLGESRILDTQKGEGGAIIHKVDRVTFKEGDVVKVRLDWPHRAFYMQVHTAQHMISGLLFTRHGIGTLAIHQGEEILTVETNREKIEEALCLQLEDEVNKAVLEGHGVHYEELTRAQALAHNLRRSIKVEGDDIRLVVIEGVDEIACGGLHVRNTREVELVQYVGKEMIRGHVRLIFRVAASAKREIRQNRMLLERMHALFSCRSDTLLESAKHLLDECHQAKGALNRLREQVARNDWALLPDGVATLDITDKPYALQDLVGAIDGARNLAVLAVCRNGASWRWLLSCTGRYRGFSFADHRAELLDPVDGKGGGRAPLYQGSATGDIARFFETFRGFFA